MKKILMTGGGTAGHVTPNIALMPALKEAGYEISYIGSYEGMEKELIKEQGIPYYGISSGKLRRYFDWKNFSDPFKVLKGYGEAVHLIKKLKPDVVFSKGGFVSVPVIFAAKHCHVPAIIHESDLTPGLANRLAIPKAEKVCCNFPETLQYLPDGKAVLTGSPIRQELLHGSRERAIALCGFKDDRKPVLLIVALRISITPYEAFFRSFYPISRLFISVEKEIWMHLYRASWDMHNLSMPRRNLLISLHLLIWLFLVQEPTPSVSFLHFTSQIF